MAFPENAAAPPPEKGRLRTAHVVFVDIVGYSLLATDEQSRAVSLLQSFVRDLPGFTEALVEHELICIPTGDGMAIVCFGEPTTPVRFARDLAIRIRDEAFFALRIGLNYGPVYCSSDINAGMNVAGNGINVAQRIMDCGDAGHILLSQSVADTLLQLSNWQSTVHDLGECEVKHGLRLRIFNLFTPEFGNAILPRKLVNSANHGAEPYRAPAVHPPSTHNLGRLVIKMCNRRGQEDEFKRLFVGHAADPGNVAQMYVLPGDEGECHESLVERLAYHVEVLAGEAEGQDRPPVKLKRIPWQYEGNLESRKRHLFAWLVEQLAAPQQLQMVDPSPAALGRLLSNQLASFVILQHDIRASRWDDVTVNLIQSYREFLRAIPCARGGQKLLVFLNVIYPSPPDSPLNPMRLPHMLRRRRIQWDLRNANPVPERRPACPCTVLSELSPVTRDDVMEWFSLHNIGDSEEERLSRSDRIFPRGQHGLRRHMSEVEAFLRDVHCALVKDSACR